MATARTIDVAERRARLGVRHALATRVGTVEEATAAVVALHSSDPTTVHLAARARTGSTGVADVERALYDDRTLVRMHAMRRAALVARFGPLTMADVRWWTGWSVAHLRPALAAAEVVEVAVDGGPAFVAADDVDPVAAPAPWVALLPALDPTTMGWKGREWYLGDLGPVLFDRNGNAGPAVWCDGRIVGGWAQRPDGTVVVDVRADVGREAVAVIDAEAAALTDWYAGIVPTPRFRTPLEQALSAGADLP